MGGLFRQYTLLPTWRFAADWLEILREKMGQTGGQKKIEWEISTTICAYLCCRKAPCKMQPSPFPPLNRKCTSISMKSFIQKPHGRRLSAAIWNWSGGGYNGICFRRDLPGHVVGQPALLQRRLTIDPEGFHPRRQAAPDPLAIMWGCPIMHQELSGTFRFNCSRLPFSLTATGSHYYGFFFSPHN